MKLVCCAYHNTGTIFLREARLFQDLFIQRVYTYEDAAPEGVWFDSVLDFCIDHAIPASVVNNINDVQREIMDLKPDVIISVGCKDIMSEEILGIPTLGCINFHGSLLPKYRGRAPLNWAILNGEKEVGATVHFITKGLDDGDILCQESVKVDDDESIASLLNKIYVIYQRLSRQIVDRLLRGDYKGTPQDESLATAFPARRPSDGAIDWNQPAKIVRRLVRATSKPYPGAFTFYKNHKLIVDSVSIFADPLELEAGALTFRQNRTLVGTGTFPVVLEAGRIDGNMLTHGRITRRLIAHNITHFNHSIAQGILLTHAGSTAAQNCLDALVDVAPRLHGVDMDPFCYARVRLGKRFHVVPPVESGPEYVEALLDLCQSEDIQLLIPCSNDDELLLLSEQRKRFTKIGTVVALPDHQIVRDCDDKIAANKMAAKAGLTVPNHFRSLAEVQDEDFPLIAKPRRGNGSDGISTVSGKDQLLSLNLLENEYFLQEYVEGREVTVDICYDNKGMFIVGLARERIMVKNGLCVKTRFHIEHETICEAKKLCDHLGYKGMANIQFIGRSFIEMNPRLPGGLGLSMLSGICWPLLVVKVFLNRAIWPEDLKARDGLGLRVWKDVHYDTTQ